MKFRYRLGNVIDEEMEAAISMDMLKMCCPTGKISVWMFICVQWICLCYMCMFSPVRVCNGIGRCVYIHVCVWFKILHNTNQRISDYKRDT